jgi:hypothetical protein
VFKENRKTVNANLLPEVKPLIKSDTFDDSAKRSKAFWKTTRGRTFKSTVLSDLVNLASGVGTVVIDSRSTGIKYPNNRIVFYGYALDSRSIFKNPDFSNACEKMAT